MEKGGFWAGFAQAFSLIFVSEIGDKTFILVTIYASKYAWYWVLPTAVLGMSIMHSLSTGLGMIFVLFIPRVATQSIAIALFWLMGLYSLYQGAKEYVLRARRKRQGLPESEEESGDERAELEKIMEDQAAMAAGRRAAESQVQQEEGGNDIELAAVKNAERQANPAAANEGAAAEEGKEPATQVQPAAGETAAPAEKKKKQSWFMCIKNPVLFFLALLMCSEWGDRSQISAIALAPNYGITSIILGGILAHGTCCTMALLLGKVFGKCCKERLINIVGGLLFLFFGFWELFFGILYPDIIDW